MDNDQVLERRLAKIEDRGSRIGKRISILDPRSSLLGTGGSDGIRMETDDRGAG
jgi:hypothetical protein